MQSSCVLSKEPQEKLSREKKKAAFRNAERKLSKEDVLTRQSFHIGSLEEKQSIRNN